MTKCINLFSPCQTAYINGRRISDNLQIINEIINKYDSQNLEGYLVSLDAKKAFDSVDHVFMCKVLKRFNFSDKFISIIKTLYAKLSADVMVNGIRYGLLQIQKGVKQGDSLSCILFILCMEALLVRINTNDNIQGVAINDFVIKHVTFADDITPLVKTINSVREFFSEYNRFSSFSGIKLNKNKTEILPLGSAKLNVNLVIILDEVIQPVNTIKIGGVWFGSDPAEIKEKNI